METVCMTGVHRTLIRASCETAERIDASKDMTRMREESPEVWGGLEVLSWLTWAKRRTSSNRHSRTAAAGEGKRRHAGLPKRTSRARRV